MKKYVTKIMGIRDKVTGEVVLQFPPRFGADGTIKGARWDEVKKFAEMSDTEPCLVEVEVEFTPTGRVAAITNNPRGSARAVHPEFQRLELQDNMSLVSRNGEGMADGESELSTGNVPASESHQGGSLDVAENSS